MYYRFIAPALLLSFAFVFPAADASATMTGRDGAQITRADNEWYGKLEPLIRMYTGLRWLMREDGVKTAPYAKLLRDTGLSFREKYPEDPRWKEWFIATTFCAPSYLLNEEQEKLAVESFYARGERRAELARMIRYDEEARGKWQAINRRLRAEFMAAPYVTDEERARLIMHETWHEVTDAIFAPHARFAKQPIDRDDCLAWLADSRERFLQLANMKVDWKKVQFRDHFPVVEQDMRMLASWLTRLAGYADDRTGSIQYLEKLAKSGCPTVQEMATGQLMLERFSATPLELSFTSTAGERIDLASLRGKVVLLQYWATDCAGCVQSIPSLTKLYEKYHDAGLEIVGLTSDTDLAKVKKVMDRYGMHWPQRMDAGLWKQEYKDFGFLAVSNYLLLGKEGKLIHYASLSLDRQIETSIRAELGLGKEEKKAD